MRRCWTARGAAAFLLVQSITSHVHHERQDIHEDHSYWRKLTENVFDRETGVSDHDGVSLSRCGTPETTEARRQERMSVIDSYRAYQERLGSEARLDTLVSIRVCTHVVRPGFFQRVSDADIQRQIDVLNEGFSSVSCCDENLEWCEPDQCSVNAGFEFVWDQSCSTRTRNRSWYSAGPFEPAEIDMKQSLHVGGPETLNLYIRGLQGVLGFARAPDDYERNPQLDGVDIADWSLDGTSGPYGEGKTATHEG